MLKSVFKNKETSVLNTDSYDRRRFNHFFEMSQGLQRLGDVEKPPLFKELLGDIWSSLYKLKPELKDIDEIKESLYPNHQLMNRIMNEKSYQDYHTSTRLDDTLSAIGTLNFGEQTYRWIQEQLETDEELKRKMEKLSQLQEQSETEDGNQNSNSEAGEYGEASNAEQAFNQAMLDLANQLNKSLNSESFGVAMKIAINDTNLTKRSLESLFGGREAGTGKSELQNMPLPDKIKLAEILSRDSDLKEIAKWTGRYTKIARTKQKMKHKESTEQSGVEIGNSLERVLPSELIQYTNPKTKNDFLKRYAEGQLMQYEQKGKESLGQGSIILCLDQSGSMETLDNQAKGFALALMSIAKKQKRNFAYIPFSKNVGRVMQFPKGKIKANEMIQIAKEFMNGGTNFSQPLNKALEVVKKDNFNDADIIFVTDGEARLTDRYINDYNKAKEKENFNVISLVIGESSPANTVRKFSNRVVIIKDFNDEGSYEAFEI